MLYNCHKCQWWYSLVQGRNIDWFLCWGNSPTGIRYNYLNCQRLCSCLVMARSCFSLSGSSLTGTLRMFGFRISYSQEVKTHNASIHPGKNLRNIIGISFAPWKLYSLDPNFLNYCRQDRTHWLLFHQSQHLHNLQNMWYTVHCLDSMFNNCHRLWCKDQYWYRSTHDMRTEDRQFHQYWRRDIKYQWFEGVVFFRRALSIISKTTQPRGCILACFVKIFYWNKLWKS